MLAKDQRALGVFERKVLRTSFGGVQDADGAWRRCMNQELHALLGEPTITHMVKIGRLRWAGHVMRMSDDSPTKMNFSCEVPSGGTGRRRGAQRARWMDQIKEDLQIIRRLSGWRTTAQDRVVWRRLMATARATPALAW